MLWLPISTVPPGPSHVAKAIRLIPRWLVVSTHLKNISQIGSSPQVGVEFQKELKPPRRLFVGDTPIIHLSMIVEEE